MERRYVEGMDRNDQNKVVSHIYAYSTVDPASIEGPLCSRGWNREDGHGFSIFRGQRSDRGTCKVCRKRMAEGCGPVPARDRKTKWI